MVVLLFSRECSARSQSRRAPHPRSISCRVDPDRTKAAQGTALDDRHTRWSPWPDSDSFHPSPGGVCITRMYGLPHTIFVDHLTGPARIDTLNIPNYTGSTGFGDFYVQKLIGKCGTLDVEDVKATVDLLVREGKGEYGPGKQFVTGGSHGGFLTAHRECDYPFF